MAEMIPKLKCWMFGHKRGKRVHPSAVKDAVAVAVSSPTQEEAENFAEQAELAADARREEKMLDPREEAWRELTELPAYTELSNDHVNEQIKKLCRATFDFAWNKALRNSARLLVATEKQ